MVGHARRAESSCRSRWSVTRIAMSGHGGRDGRSRVSRRVVMPVATVGHACREESSCRSQWSVTRVATSRHAGRDGRSHVSRRVVMPVAIVGHTRRDKGSAGARISPVLVTGPVRFSVELAATATRRGRPSQGSASACFSGAWGTRARVRPTVTLKRPSRSTSGRSASPSLPCRGRLRQRRLHRSHDRRARSLHRGGRVAVARPHGRGTRRPLRGPGLAEASQAGRCCSSVR
jgi:hypothetical protein